MSKKKKNLQNLGAFKNFKYCHLKSYLKCFKKFSDKTYLLVSFARITVTESEKLLRIIEVAQSCFHLLLSWIWENESTKCTSYY